MTALPEKLSYPKKPVTVTTPTDVEEHNTRSCTPEIIRRLERIAAKSDERFHALIRAEFLDMWREGSLPEDRDTALAQIIANIVMDHVTPTDVVVSIRNRNLMLAAFFVAEEGHIEVVDKNPEAARLFWQTAKTAMRIAMSSGMLDDADCFYVHGEQPGVSGGFVRARA